MRFQSRPTNAQSEDILVNDLAPSQEIDDDHKQELKQSENRPSKQFPESPSVSTASSCSKQNSSDDVEGKTSKIDSTSRMDQDCDFELNHATTSLEKLILADSAKPFEPKDKKKMFCVNELYHTEKVHVLNLKIVYHVFYKPIKASRLMSDEEIKLVFPNLEELLYLHQGISCEMKRELEKWCTESSSSNIGCGNIGELLENIFDGEAAENITRIVTKYSKNQQHALDVLNKKIRNQKGTNDEFVRFITEAEKNPVCRKLQLKDMIPAEIQRLVKYPLLLEAIAKNTTEPSEEARILRVAASVKRICKAVNNAKTVAENRSKLEELQKRIVSSTSNKKFGEHAPFDLTSHSLIHDGRLTCRFNRRNQFKLHVVLLENVLVFLRKQKIGNHLHLKPMKFSKTTEVLPILPLMSLNAKSKAGDKNAFYVIFNYQKGVCIYELYGQTQLESRNWIRLINEQIDKSKQESKSPAESPDDESHPELGKQLAVSAIAHGNRLLDSINEEQGSSK